MQNTIYEVHFHYGKNIAKRYGQPLRYLRTYTIVLCTEPLFWWGDPVLEASAKIDYASTRVESSLHGGATPSFFNDAFTTITPPLISVNMDFGGIVVFQ